MVNDGGNYKENEYGLFLELMQIHIRYTVYHTADRLHQSPSSFSQAAISLTGKGAEIAS
jgi:hypothetical protein